MYTTKQILIGVVLLLFAVHHLNAQCNDELSEGFLIVNELGNTASGTNGEFIELLVIGSVESPGAPVDLSGWIIDDNNVENYFLGNEPGHIRLSESCFSEIPPGSIILLYNADAQIEGIDTNKDGMPNEDGVYQLPIISECIVKHNGCPTVQYGGYDCPVDESSHSIFEYESVWNDYIPMRNLGDGIQVRNPAMEFVHGVYWIIDEFPAGGVKVDVWQSASGRSIQFIGQDNWLSADQYLVTTQFSSPGMPNSPENESLVNALIAGNTNPIVLEIVCGFEQPATGLPNPDGIGLVEIISGIGPYTIKYEGPIEGEMTTDCIGTILIPNLMSGQYNISVFDALGCEQNCFFVIPENAQLVYECPDFASEDCTADLVSFLQTYYEEETDCEQWLGDVCSTTSNLHRFGKVGIGTNDVPSGYMLSVKGGVRTDEILVELCAVSEWCDYVFDEDYSLLPIADLRRYIRQNKHLPGMISQAEIIAEGGIELKAIATQQQEKIEELVLYLLETKTRVDDIQKKIDALRQENQLLRAAQKEGQ